MPHCLHLVCLRIIYLLVIVCFHSSEHKTLHLSTQLLHITQLVCSKLQGHQRKFHYVMIRSSLNNKMRMPFFRTELKTKHNKEYFHLANKYLTTLHQHTPIWPGASKPGKEVYEIYTKLHFSFVQTILSVKGCLLIRTAIIALQHLSTRCGGLRTAMRGQGMSH